MYTLPTRLAIQFIKYLAGNVIVPIGSGFNGSVWRGRQTRAGNVYASRSGEQHCKKDPCGQAAQR